MSLLEKLTKKINPKEQIKKQMLARLPHVKEDLNLMLDDLFLQVAEQKKMNPFELILIIHKTKTPEHGTLAIGSFFSANKKEVGKINAGALIQDLFLKQISVLPETLKGVVFEELGTQNVYNVVLKALKGKRLLIRYDKNDEFEFVEVTKTANNIIDVNEFIDTFEF